MKSIEPLIGIALTLPDRASGRLQHAIHEQLRAGILDGRLRPGLRLPSSRDLARSLGVARITVVTAYERLLAEDYVVVRRGAGTFVADWVGRAAAPASAGDPVVHAPFNRFVCPGVLRDLPGEKGPSEGRQAGIGLRGSASSSVEPSIKFEVGTPDVRELRSDIWNRLGGRALRALCREGDGYGPPQGVPALRDAIAHHVSFSRAVSAQAGGIVVTAGAQQAFALLAQVFVTPGETVAAFEEPGYAPATAAFAAAGAKIVHVPVDPEGIVVDQIPPSARLIYVTPSHQFPLGVVMSARRRAALLEFARDHDALVIEDDYDSEFRFSGRPLDALQTLGRAQRVFYVGTFSKSLFPSLRIGFVVAPPWAAEALVAAKHRMDWHVPTLAQETLAAFMAQGHLARHVRRLRPIYAGRRALITDLLRRDLDEWLRPIPGDAGLHLAAMLRPGLKAADVAREALEMGVGVYPFRCVDAQVSGPEGLALGYGALDEADIRRGLDALGKAVMRCV